MTQTPRRELGWPAASTLIAAVIGTVATLIAFAFTLAAQIENHAESRFSSAREIGEVKARLTAIEDANRQLRVELRSDIKELRKLMQRILKQR